ncbi:NAD(P)-dependent dehydrogenase, short-chain alcohol dehydrogenase family [Mucilaginibacter mallensis]|uniref:NAD(P)-dependent dehydrogenase, short-chain alcohol dehydrogenase family n=1 Tax=Mucilaginibacter mallensis TaxID=652787 RepID=A0A1H1RIM8_MUCMA|nr:SDR family oxidoreductase [Mucilaginibacter mallensis]SDS35542.1 NAD(P)-dependent dehydrogenase, short-chain alcohol dehydrogenase family [Mucilaginibacter mallensis]
MLNNKVILLTGGTEGIGFECAKAYEKAGAMIGIISNSAESIQQASLQLNAKNVHYIKADVANAAEVEQAVQETISKFGKIDIVHNNAGIANPSKALHETNDDEWERLFAVNVKGIYHTTRFALNELKNNKGNILNTSSLVGDIGQEIHAAYSATKGAINALTKSMALDYAPIGIRVNAVAPAGVWTPMLRNWSTQQPNPELIAAYLDGIHVLGYCPEGDVVADACLFMVSDMARFITGCILPVTGGAELGYRKNLYKVNSEKAVTNIG